MKVLLIHTSMTGGGIQSIVCNLANELLLKNIDVTVCSICQPNKDDIFWNKLNDGVNKVTLGKQGGGFSLAIVFKIYKFFKNENFDIIHIHGFFCYYMLSIFLLHNKTKFFYTIHSDAYMENGKWDRRFIAIKKYCFKKEWISPITISHASQESFRKLYGCNSILVYNGIPEPNIEHFCDFDIQKYKVTPNTKLFIHVGRIDESKNQVVLCRVFQRLVDEGYDISLLIVGGITSPAIFNDLKQYFNNRINYLGARADVACLMSKCDAMCLPSLWEGLPIVMLEALSVGCVPICSPVGGIVNVLTHGINGILSKSSQFEDYYCAMRHFLELSDNCRKEMSKYAIETFQKYTAKEMTRNYLNAYMK
jgi:glycosyltransferase involved in cell wall biosynthesis